MNDLTKYESIKGGMKTGDCLLWASSSCLGWLIRKFSKATVNHASLVVRPPDYQGLKDRRFQLEALENGIVLRTLSTRLKEFKGQVWWLPLKDIYRAEPTLDRIGSWAFLQVGSKYDYNSLFKQAIGRVSADARKFFCSEFWFLACQQAGVPLTGKAPRPGDIPKYDVFARSVKILERPVKTHVEEDISDIEPPGTTIGF